MGYINFLYICKIEVFTLLGCYIAQVVGKLPTCTTQNARGLKASATLWGSLKSGIFKLLGVHM
jgi:hypothetical protein